jgi:hypothetical protein
MRRRFVAIALLLTGVLMAETLLWSDDFPYANDAALEAVYPYPFDNTFTSVTSPINVVTPGPPGYATGIDTRRVNIDYGGLFNVAQWLIAPTTRCFHFRAVWKIDAVDTVNTTIGLVNMAQLPADGTDFYGIYWDLAIRIDDPTALNLTVNGGTYPTPAYVSGYITGLLTPNAANQIDVSGFISSLTETSPGSGVYAPNADGSVIVKVNDVTVISWSGIVWNNHDSLATPVWNDFEIHPAGTMSGLRIWQCDSATIPPNDTNPCCAKPRVPGNGPPPGRTGDTPPPDPTITLPEWIRNCVCGGAVDTAADLVDVEDWSL